MIKLEKDGGVKMLDEASPLIPVLESQGWEIVSETVTIEEPVSKPKKAKKQEVETEGYID